MRPSVYRKRDPAWRFWKKVNRNGPIVRAELGPCWVWTAAHTARGYGLFTRRKGDPGSRNVLAHRFSWELAHGPIPDGLFVLHRCDNTQCVHPDHLFLGDHDDNMSDMAAKGRAAAGEAHPRSVLIEADVIRFREAHGNGASFSDISRDTGYSRSTVRSAAIGETWKHVPAQSASATS